MNEHVKKFIRAPHLQLHNITFSCKFICFFFLFFFGKTSSICGNFKAYKLNWFYIIKRIWPADDDMTTVEEITDSNTLVRDFHLI